MSDKEVEGLFCNLSRKELQILCKKHGLPARKSNSVMVESLHSYFQKDLRWISSSKSLGGLQETSFPQSRAPPNLAGNTIKDRCAQRSDPREDNDKRNVYATFNELESFAGPKACYKERFGGSIDNFQDDRQFQFLSSSCGNNVNHKDPSRNYSGRVEDGLQFHCRKIDVGLCPQDNASISVKTSIRAPPAFEFYASSEEGIELSVDLSSSPSDWIKKYNSQVYLCENMRNTKSQSHRQELGCIGETNAQIKSSFLWCRDPVQIKDGCSQVKPSSSLVIERNIHGGIDHPDGGNKSLISLPLISGGAAVDVLQCQEKDHGLVSCKPNSDMHNQIVSNTDSCTKTGCRATLDSDLTDASMEKTACNFAGNSTSDGSTDVLVSGNPRQDDELHVNSMRQHSCHLGNNNAVCHACLASQEIQLSEAGNFHKGAMCSPHKNGEFLDVVASEHDMGTKQDTLANSSENDPCANHLSACSKEQEWSNVISGRDSSFSAPSRGSTVDYSLEKTCSKSDSLEPSEELPKKRPIDNESQNECGKPEAKVLRTVKHSGGGVLPRRSTRLVSK